MDWNAITLLIVDLDNTLADTFHTLSKNQWAHVERKLAERGWDSAYRELGKDFGKTSFKHALKHSSMTPEQVRYAISLYDEVDVTALRLYPDAEAILGVDIPKVLITRGEPALQERKIAHLGIRKHFLECVIVGTFESKDGAIRAILERHHRRPEEALIIGDRLEEEIATGNSLGAPTVLVRRPDWPVQKGTAQPDLTVRKLTTIAKRLR